MRMSHCSTHQLLVGVGALLLTATHLAAQGTVRGRVVEIGTERPIADAQITITGTPSGGVTNDRGDFVITAVPNGQREIIARRIGFGSVC